MGSHGSKGGMTIPAVKSKGLYVPEDRSSSSSGVIGKEVVDDREQKEGRR